MKGIRIEMPADVRGVVVLGDNGEAKQFYVNAALPQELHEEVFKHCMAQAE